MNLSEQTLSMLGTGIWETLFMTFVSSFLAYVIGIPLGICLVVSSKDGIKPMPPVNVILGIIINILRSIPFIILLIIFLTQRYQTPYLCTPASRISILQQKTKLAFNKSYFNFIRSLFNSNITEKLKQVVFY